MGLSYFSLEGRGNRRICFYPTWTVSSFFSLTVRKSCPSTLLGRQAQQVEKGKTMGSVYIFLFCSLDILAFVLATARQVCTREQLKCVWCSIKNLEKKRKDLN